MAVLRIAAFGAADDEAVLRAGEGDVEQASVLAKGARVGDGAELGAEFGVVGFGAGPDRRAVFGDEDAVAGAVRGAGVRQDDDGGFEAFGAVDGHHAHFILRAGEFALHLAAAPFHGIEEGLEAGRLAGVEGGGAIDEGGDGFARGTAEAGEDQLPAGARQTVAAFEGVGEEFEGRLVAALENVFEEGGDGKVRGLHGGPQAASARVGDGEELVVVEASKGALEDFGEGEVVFRAEGEADEIEQVLHGERVEQLDAVGAGDGDVLAFQGLKNSIKETGGAAAHEDEEVAGAAGALCLAVPDGGAGVDFAANELRDAGREFRFGAGGGFLAARRGPRFGGLDFRRRFERPEFDGACFVAAEGRVAHHVGRVGRVHREGRVGNEDICIEDGVDIVEHLFRRAERHGEIGEFVVEVGRAGVRLEGLLLGEEVFRVGALEGIDRLLLVADDEERALFVADRAGAGIDVVGEGLEDLPLGGAGVLRFVEQDVGDAAVELPQHPFSGVLAGEELRGCFDQVVEVEAGAGALAAGEVLEQDVG